MNNENVFQMKFGKVYGLLVDKAVRKGRTKAEVDDVICWLTGYGPEQLEAFAGRLTEYKTSKGAIQLPYGKPLPLELIAEIAKWCEESN